MTTPIWPIEGVALDSTGDMVTGSLAAKVNTLGAYFSEKLRVYPTLAAGTTIVSDNTDWGLGTITQIMPASTVAVDFYLHALVIESCTKDGVYEMVIYQGADDTEVARVRFAVAGGFFGNFFVLSGPLIPANARIRAQLACNTGLAAAATMTVSLSYHQTA